MEVEYNPSDILIGFQYIEGTDTGNDRDVNLYCFGLGFVTFTFVQWVD